MVVFMFLLPVLFMSMVMGFILVKMLEQKQKEKELEGNEIKRCLFETLARVDLCSSNFVFKKMGFINYVGEIDRALERLQRKMSKANSDIEKLRSNRIKRF